jgi:hypothetical protein
MTDVAEALAAPDTDGYCFTPEDEELATWTPTPMADLRPGDLFKFVPEAELAKVGVPGEFREGEALNAQARAFEELILMSPIMRYVESREGAPGRSGCRAEVW